MNDAMNDIPANQFDMVCPKCGRTDQLDIAATVWVRLTPDGTDNDAADDGDHEWDDDSVCRCAACGWAGTVLNASPDDGDGDPVHTAKLRALAEQMLSMLNDLANGYPWKELGIDMDLLRAQADALGIKEEDDDQ